jgi:hypothetical protein
LQNSLHTQSIRRQLIISAHQLDENEHKVNFFYYFYSINKELHHQTSLVLVEAATAQASSAAVTGSTIAIRASAAAESKVHRISSASSFALEYHGS